MSTHAIETTADAPTAVRVMRNVDLAVLVIALPLFLVADINIVAWITGAGLYVGQRLVRAWAQRKAERADDPRTTVGLLAGSMLARGWIVAGTILAVGLSTESEVGLWAAILFLATFTVNFTMALAMGGPKGAASAVSAAPLPPERRRP